MQIILTEEEYNELKNKVTQSTDMSTIVIDIKNIPHQGKTIDIQAHCHENPTQEQRDRLNQVLSEIKRYFDAQGIRPYF